MIISNNNTPPPAEFSNLLANTYSLLTAHAKSDQRYYQTLNASTFEEVVFEKIKRSAQNTPFENTIELVSGQKFPDIVVKKFYGIEVKTTKKNHWKTTGNSVLESTRVDEVKNIYLLFGKLTNPVEFCYRPYQECLYDIAVTHSPRYLIDMELQPGESIFDKMNLPYDELRTLTNPLTPFIKHFKERRLEQSAPKEDPWWINNSEQQLIQSKLYLYKDLPRIYQSELKYSAMAYFPEIFGSDQRNKYTQLSLWLVSNHSVVNSSIRDMFTAGGQETVELQGLSFSNIPKIYVNLIEGLDNIKQILTSTHQDILSSYWEEYVNSQTPVQNWARIFLRNATASYPHLISFFQQIIDEINKTSS